MSTAQLILFQLFSRSVAQRGSDNPSDAADQQGRPSITDGTLNDYTPAPLYLVSCQF
jgi:hypothetical protein